MFDALCVARLHQMIRGFKFGILYAKEGQTKEDEMFANGAPSDKRLCDACDSVRC
jgi:hypothetical protein